MVRLRIPRYPQTKPNPNLFRVGLFFLLLSRFVRAFFFLNASRLAKDQAHVLHTDGVFLSEVCSADIGNCLMMGMTVACVITVYEV